jgi:D-arabinose 1-dehydrogenase-like Zn-dependent alcohol dehydrogenase
LAYVFKAPYGIDPAILVAASCSGATAAHGFELARPEPGETVAAALVGESGCRAAGVDLRKLQQILAKDGVLIHKIF